jgi:hypothetical protein
LTTEIPSDVPTFLQELFVTDDLGDFDILDLRQRVIEYVKDKPKSVRSADGLWSVEMLAERWAFSTDKTSRVLEGYRGQPGFSDFGSAENVRTHKRRFSIIRITSALLQRIESEHNGTTER